MFEIWNDDLFLYTVDNQYQADEMAAEGFRVVQIA